MLGIPFEVLSVCWPRPVATEDRRWVSDPEWDAPVSPLRPQPAWRMVEGEPAWTIDWCSLFRGGVVGGAGSEMKRFHVVFRIRAAATGKLVFWDDDGSIVRLGGRVVHEDRGVHALRRAELEVQAGDVLEVAQWQNDGDWLWGAQTTTPPPADAEAVFAPHRDLVAERVRTGDGPPLKLYTDGRHPLRSVVAVYSLVLNGYAPGGVILYGDYQWSPEAREMFASALPFAEVVPAERVVAAAQARAGRGLAENAWKYWYVMKVASMFLDGPAEFCFIDDDVVVLEAVDDALEAFRSHDLVFVPDIDYARDYHQTWSPVFHRKDPTPGGTFNAGLFWCRRVHERRWLAERMARVPGGKVFGCYWDQGFISTAYADKPMLGLPANRYFYPIFDGLPNGVLGYDFANNPCGFASLHWGGLGVKPGDDAMRYLGPQVLSRRTACVADAELALAG